MAKLRITSVMTKTSNIRRLDVVIILLKNPIPARFRPLKLYTPIECPCPTHAKVPCIPTLTDFVFKTSPWASRKKGFKQNQTFGQNVENKKCHAALSCYLALRSIILLDSDAIVTRMELDERKRGRRPGTLLRLVVSITL